MPPPGQHILGLGCKNVSAANVLSPVSLPAITVITAQFTTNKVQHVISVQLSSAPMRQGRAAGPTPAEPQQRAVTHNRQHIIASVAAQRPLRRSLCVEVHIAQANVEIHLAQASGKDPRRMPLPPSASPKVVALRLELAVW